MPHERILVVDDDREVVRLMRGYLEKAGYEVYEAYNGETALHILRRELPDLLLLDLMLPDRDGWEITRIVRSDPTLLHIPIIMLTAKVSDTDKIVGLEMGADDYVTKPYNPREVVARIRARLRNEGDPQDQSKIRILKVGNLQQDIRRREVLLDGVEVRLTVTEFEILRVLMEQSGFVVTRSDIIRKALGIDFEGVERTLDSHMRNLRNKIEPDPKNPTYIRTVYGVGYKLESGVNL